MSPRWQSSLCAAGLALVMVGAITHDAFAQRGGGGRGGGRGAAGTTGSSTGFSRDGAAATGGLSSRSGVPRQGGQSGQSGQTGQRGQVSGQSAEQRGQNQAARQESRQSMQSNRIEAYEDNQWDAGKGLAIAGGAALAAGTVAAISSAATAPPPPGVAPGAAPVAAPAPATLPPPCANAQVAAAGDITYYQCGSAWYTLAYGANGPAYVQSAPPPGG